MDNTFIGEDGFDIVNDPSITSIPSTMVPKDATVTTSTATTTNTEIPVKLVYSKSKVYVHPSTNASDYIPGYISIVEKASHDYLIAWTPEAEILSKDIDAYVKIDSNPEENNEDVSSTFMLSSIADLPERHSLYALSIPLNDVRSLLVHPPSFTKWYGSIVINFQDGSSSAPLWFHDDESRSTVLQKNTQGGKFSEDRPGNNKNQQVRWGGDEFIYRLNQLIFIQQSKEEKHLYLVGENQPRKSQDESTTPEEGKNTNNNNSSSSSATKSTQTSTGSSSGSGSNHQFDTSVFDSTQMDPWVATWKEFKWSALEKLSRITTFTRNTTAAATSQVVPHLPPKIQMVLNTDAVRATTQDYDSARIYLAKWAADLAARSEQDTPLERRYRHVGIWGHGDAWEEETALGVFEVLNSENDFSIPTHTRTKPITKEEWDSFFDHDTGKLSVGEPYIRKRIFCGGLDPSIRREAWLFLTNVYPWDSTAAEREKLTSEYRESYVKIRSRWLDDPQVRESAHFLDQKHRIDKDVHRTDRTVGFYAKEDMPNPDPIMHVGTNKNLEKLKELLCTYNMLDNDLGYVQGMSDLLSPLYMVIGDDELVFQAFVGFMNRTKSNFYMDQTGMRRHLMTMDALLQFMDPKLFKHLQRTDSDNLFFCFRWFLVWFKRELSWDDTLTMWEVLWSDYLTEYFTFFVALSILDQHRDAIIDYLQSFDEILKYINDLSMAINLQETLQRAEILYYQFRQRVEAVDNKKQKMQEILSTKNKEGEGDVDDEEQRKQAEKDLSKLPDMNEYLRRLYSGNDAYEKNNSSSSLNEKH